ncbi:iron complex outermembrane receptor protein [Bisgaardia hudsonensis]|uniref:Iron complex outermembrane receptor protein n=1 Tax=Bisgaardia hudsonensis TaxID=109472 RepID=A0A4R2MR79_9PAST|nr:TonB-dependent receptor [Bisgaardia hudsonensis]QLB13541.1 hypothetical protein A6A11_07945 [Bisgaardia hudsonensis]TCP11165.1 iron complex outermembrane receptor protein [Bisgaardia hudsonensis]
MRLKKNQITLILFGSFYLSTIAYAQQTILEEISVVAKQEKFAGSTLQDYLKVNDHIVKKEKLQMNSATLGNALSGELGVHSNPFGGGASTPVIRGQEGVRVKILQNASDAIDMSTLSPDHAVVVDTLLAQRVELVRGSSTLLYSTASPAGVVNIVDQRIPTQIPEKGYKGEINTRVDTASKERSATVGLTFGLTDHIALRLEGLQRHSDNYQVRGIHLGDTLKYVPDTHNRSKVGTVGLSFIDDKGYLGISYNYRKDKYGLPGHNHKFDTCTGHIIDPNHSTLKPTHYYLDPYPHLMNDSDLLDIVHFHCGTDYDLDPKHSHDHPYGHEHDHSHTGPWVDLESKRVDVRGEINQPFLGIEKARLTLAFADYYHDEKDAGKSGDTLYPNRGNPQANFGKANAKFKNKGFNSRLEFEHTPIGKLTGTFGIQYQQQKSSATTPPEFSRDGIKSLNPLIENTNKQIGVFAVEQYRTDNWFFEIGARFENQRTPIYYDHQLLERFRNKYKKQRNTIEETNFSTRSENAFSYTGTAEWYFSDNDRLSATLSHNERFPTPMELYYHGKHLATNSFEYGNRDLTKEKSNNIEIGIARENSFIDYRINAYYNHFKNYIHNENLFRSGNLFMRRYNQAKARFYGFEGELTVNFTPEHKMTIFGDYITGKLKNLGTIYGDNIYQPYTCIDEYDGWEDTCYKVIGIEQIHKPDRNAARVPPSRLGIRFNNQFGEHWSTLVEYTHVFSQKKTSVAIHGRRPPKDDDDDPTPPLEAVYVKEDVTMRYDLLNLGITYANKVGNVNYKVILNANNLLNEKIYIHNSYLPYVPQMGRNFVLGLNLTF